MLRLFALSLLVVGCSGIRVAERSLRGAERAVVRADGTVVIAGGRLRGVKIRAFMLDVHEVTVRQYRACVAAGGCTAAPDSIFGCNLRGMYVEDHPINCVTAHEAVAYCRWRGARLPTRHEWEWAAQGREQARRYVWGDYPRRRSYRYIFEEFEPFVCGRPPLEIVTHTATCTVGGHDRSRDGIADLGGNVAEWVHTPRGSLAVGQSWDYPYISTSEYARGRRWWVPAQDTIVQTLADPVAQSEHALDARVGFRCARTAAEAP